MTLKSYTPLKARKPLNRMSLNKVVDLNGQVNTRIALCQRAGGKPQLRTRIIKFNNGTEMFLTTVICTNGYCEECGRFFRILDCHEKFERGKGGKVSMENSVILCRPCHNKKKGSPMWSGME